MESLVTVHSTMLDIGSLIADSYQLLQDEHRDTNCGRAKLALCQLERAYLRYAKELNAIRDTEVAEAESRLMELMK